MPTLFMISQSSVLSLPVFLQLEIENTTSVEMKEEVVSGESSGRPVRGDGGSDGNFEIQ